MQLPKENSTKSEITIKRKTNDNFVVKKKKKIKECNEPEDKKSKNKASKDNDKIRILQSVDSDVDDIIEHRRRYLSSIEDPIMRAIHAKLLSEQDKKRENKSYIVNSQTHIRSKITPADQPFTEDFATCALPPRSHQYWDPIKAEEAKFRLEKRKEKAMKSDVRIRLQNLHKVSPKKVQYVEQVLSSSTFDENKEFEALKKISGNVGSEIPNHKPDSQVMDTQEKEGETEEIVVANSQDSQVTDTQERKGEGEEIVVVNSQEENKQQERHNSQTSSKSNQKYTKTLEPDGRKMKESQNTASSFDYPGKVVDVPSTVLNIVESDEFQMRQGRFAPSPRVLNLDHDLESCSTNESLSEKQTESGANVIPKIISPVEDEQMDESRNTDIDDGKVKKINNDSMEPGQLKISDLPVYTKFLRKKPAFFDLTID
eukprot:NODE_16_length_49026_cov_1.035992.p8 type:complete len:428 gc:universal NODE_16_length_49026_cov_1.035992:30999-29716(-)